MVTAMLTGARNATKWASGSPVIGWLAARSPFIELGLISLTVLFGMQALRVFIPGLVWLLGDQMGWSEPLVGAIALLVFLTAFLAGRLRRLLGTSLLIVVTAGGLGLLRLFMQILSGEPIVDLSLAMAGVVLFVLFVPACLQKINLNGRAGTGTFALGLLLGLIMDTAIHGAFYTYDISWQAGILPLLLMLLLVIVQWILLTGVTLVRKLNLVEEPVHLADKSPCVWSFPLLAIGPFLFIEIVVLHNVARAATLTGWPLPMAFGLTLLSGLIGLAAAAWLLAKPHRNLWPLALVSGIGLVAVLAIPYPQSAALTVVLLLIAQTLVSLLITLVFIGRGGSTERTAFSSITVASGVGMILLLVFLVGYYMVYYFSFPYNNHVLEPVAAFMVAACALYASAALRKEKSDSYRAWVIVVLALPILILPLAGMIMWRAPEAVHGESYPVKVMTYNLHNGFNTEGYLDMEDIAQVIESQDSDIVALQEVSRGWVISGRLDMLSWLSRRLDMPYVSGPTADPFWGNAILSRYPIVEYTEYDLPPRDLPVRRGLLSATMDLGNGGQIRVIATHYHHVEGATAIRQLQAQGTIKIWDSDEQTVLLGDLNAVPDDPEMVMLKQASLVDALAGIEPPVYTWPAPNPYLRIDYIWVSPDLKARDVHVITSNASDHLAVVAEIDR
jgi:endonuclease/exonuclease/phosphatase family metal-dependent hydrolase